MDEMTPEQREEQRLAASLGKRGSAPTYKKPAATPSQTQPSQFNKPTSGSGGSGGGRDATSTHQADYARKVQAEEEARKKAAIDAIVAQGSAGAAMPDAVSGGGGGGGVETASIEAGFDRTAADIAEAEERRLNNNYAKRGVAPSAAELAEEARKEREREERTRHADEMARKVEERKRKWEEEQRAKKAAEQASPRADPDAQSKAAAKLGDFLMKMK